MTITEVPIAVEKKFAKKWKKRENKLLQEIGGIKPMKPGAWLILNDLGHPDREQAISMAIEDIQRAIGGGVSSDTLIKLVLFGLEKRIAARELRNMQPDIISPEDLGITLTAS